MGHTRRETEAEGCCQALHRNIATNRHLEAVPPTLRQVMAAPARFERTTFPLGGGRSIQLSYGAIRLSRIAVLIFVLTAVLNGIIVSLILATTTS